MVDAFLSHVQSLGYGALPSAVLEQARAAHGERTAGGGFLHEEEMEDLIDSAFADRAPRVSFCALEVRSGSDHHAQARVTLEMGGESVTATGQGAGAVHAAFTAIRHACPYDATLCRFEVAATMRGPEAAALAKVGLEEHGRIVEGRGEDEDTVVAAAKALVHALNKLASKAETPKPVSTAFLTA